MFKSNRNQVSDSKTAVEILRNKELNAYFLGDSAIMLMNYIRL